MMISRVAATGAELGRFQVETPESVRAAVERVREAQAAWSALPWKRRREPLRRFWRALSAGSDAWTAAIRDEIGKPETEAVGELIASLDSVRWTLKHAGREVADRKVGPGWQRLMLLPTARLRWRPLGVIGIVGTWNYPLLLNAPTIAQALAVGNAVVWKPSERSGFCGDLLRRHLEAAEFPAGLMAVVQGGPEVGRALIDAPINKAVFTGGIGGGRAILRSLADRGIPALLELSGFDAAVVMPDAPPDSTAKALAWAAFVGAGQTCVAAKRAYVVGDPRPIADRIAALARSLRVGDPAKGASDVGPLIGEDALRVFDATIADAVEAGAVVLAGGRRAEIDGPYYEPTVLLAADDQPESALEGCFGPVLVVRGVPDADAAVRAANRSKFGLSASVWGRDLRDARVVADRLEAGMVAVNDAVTPSASASAPFGGLKASGFGRTRGRLGLLEFVAAQTVHARRPGGFRPHLFPYRDGALRLMNLYRRLRHPGG